MQHAKTRLMEYYLGKAPSPFGPPLGKTPSGEQRHDDPPTFELLKLDENLLLICVLPRLPIGTLAKLALTSDACARLVEKHVRHPARWTQQAAIVDALDAVRSKESLLAALSGPVGDYVEVGQKVRRAAIKAYEYKTDRLRLRSPCASFLQDSVEDFAAGRAAGRLALRFDYDSGFYPIQRGANGEPVWQGPQDVQLDDEPRVSHRLAVSALLALVPEFEQQELHKLVRSLSLRREPAQLVELLTTLRKDTALGCPWEQPFKKSGAARGRLGANLLSNGRGSDELYCLPPTRGEWTPQLLVDLVDLVFNDKGGYCGYVLASLLQSSGLHDEANVKLGASLWMARLGDDIEKQAAFITCGYYPSFWERDGIIEPYEEGPILETGAKLSEIAVQDAFSLPLVQAVVTRLAANAADYWDVYENEYENEYLARWPADFLAAWTSSVNFPLAFSLEEVASLVECVRDLLGRESLTMGSAEPLAKPMTKLAMRWIASLVEATEASTDAFALKKIGAISLALS